MNSKFYFRRGKAASWTKQNILLGPGEPGFELDTGKLKIGNGVDKWNDLPYIVNKDTLPDEIIYYIGKQDSLPEEGTDGSICIVGEDIYIRANDKWTKLNTVTKGEVEVIKIKDNDDGSLEIDGKKYDTIQEALKNVTNAEVALPTGLMENLTISAGQTITLDLNGTETITDQVNPLQVAYNGSLIIQGDGTVECNKNGAASIENNGTLNILNGVFSRSIDEKGNGYYVIVNHGYTTINDGVFSSPGGMSSLIENGYYNYNSNLASTGYVEGQNVQSPKLTINGGLFMNDYTTIKNDDNGETFINNGQFYGMIYHVGRTLDIKDGYFNASDGYENIQVKKLSQNLNCADCYISGGTFETNGSVNITGVGNPTIIITGGKFNKKVPDEYIGKGYTQTLIDGYYTITKEG